MKKYLFIAAMLVSVSGFSQEVSPKLQAEGDLVKATYYNADGTVAQEGYFKDGKLEGKWISYSSDGEKKAMGEYTAGQKTGKWFFWNGSNLSEVDYSDSRIASVKTYKKDALVVRE